jgi:hypothetical protein
VSPSNPVRNSTLSCCWFGSFFGAIQSDRNGGCFLEERQHCVPSEVFDCGFCVEVFAPAVVDYGLPLDAAAVGATHELSAQLCFAYFELFYFGADISELVGGMAVAYE